MRALLQRRAVAVLLCCLLLPASLVLNTRVGLGRQAGRVTALLYDDQKSDVRALRTIRSGLEAFASVADRGEIDSAIENLDAAIALLQGGASIATGLSAYCEALDVPIALAKLQGLDAADAQRALNALQSALYTADAAVLYERYSAAREAGDALFAALAAAGLSDSQRERVAECAELMQRLARELASNGYNEAVYSFLRRNDSGWTRLCANLAGVAYPVLFA